MSKQHKQARDRSRRPFGKWAAASFAFAMLACAPLWAAQPIVDGDGDGVDDSIDQCLYTPPDAVVDAHGCSSQNDEDGDGIVDDADACPYTPRGAQVDATGCAIDSDGDGVPNGLDRCESTPLGISVDANGCAPGESAERVIRPPAVTRPPPRPARKVPSVVTPEPVPVPVPVPAPVPQAPAVVMQPPQPQVVPESAVVEPSPAPEAITVTAAPKAVIEPRFLLELSFAPKALAPDAASESALIAAVPALGEALRSDPHAVLVIEGYADTVSDGAGADAVARGRANKVRKLLGLQGLSDRLLHSIGYPATAASGDAEGAQRKVRILLDTD